MTNRATGLKRLLIVPDTHVPFHDKKAFNLVLKVLNTIKFDRLVILGDFGDMYSVSGHLKDPDIADCIAEEADAINAELDRLDHACKKSGVKDKTYIEGNHENRLYRSVMAQMPSVRRLLRVDNLLRLKERGYGFKEYGDYHKEGKLHLTHDDGKAGPVAHIAAVNNFNGSVGIGHTHQMAMCYIGDVLDRRHVGAMFGWLGDKKSPVFNYAKTRSKQKNWQLGFGTALLKMDGTAFVHTNPIINYECEVWGQLIKL